MAIATAAQKMLALDASALMTVSTLLTQIHTVASMVQDHVAGEAENLMACYTDPDRDELRSRLSAQQNAFDHATRSIETPDSTAHTLGRA
jgi:hypothetical protein